MAICEIVHFSPDPYVDRKIPLGAFVYAEGHKRLILAPAPPEWRCAGGWRGAAIAAEALEALRSWDAAKAGLPAGFEELLVRADGYPVPDAWGDAEITSHLWGESAPQVAAPRRTRATTLGKQFFSKRGVGDLIEENLDAAVYAGGRFKAAESAGKMPQYVELEGRILLLEALRADAAKRWVEVVARRLSVWKCASTKHKWSGVKLVAYAVSAPGTDHLEADANVLDGVQDFADGVYDTRRSGDAAALIDRIREAC